MTSKSKKNLLYTGDISIFKAIIDQSGKGSSLVDQRGKYAGVNQVLEFQKITRIEFMNLTRRETKVSQKTTRELVWDWH